MYIYALTGALFGAVIGYMIPPGSLFLFILGGIAGFSFKNYAQRRWL